MTDEQYAKLLSENPDLRVIDDGNGIAPTKTTTPATKSPKATRHKYGAVKTVVDGITFDSKKEAKRYTTLKLLESIGEIKQLELQPTYILQDAYTTRDGKKVRPIKYVGDFQYWKGQQCIVEDVKGMQTPVFKLKAKMFRYKYPGIKLLIV